jgi:hypothetical protein
VDGIVLQAHLAATLQQCPNLTRLSLVGYQGSVDDLLQSAASTGAALSHLNLQHSQVSDAGLSLAAAAFPKLVSIYLCYCRCAAYVLCCLPMIAGKLPCHKRCSKQSLFQQYCLPCVRVRDTSILAGMWVITACCSCWTCLAWKSWICTTHHACQQQQSQSWQGMPCRIARM